MLVMRDINAFVSADWEQVADDFDEPAFFGVDGGKVPNPDDWKLGFPDLGSYRERWLSQAEIFRATEFAEDARAAIFDATRLTEIDINGTGRSRTRNSTAASGKQMAARTACCGRRSISVSEGRGAGRSAALPDICPILSEPRPDHDEAPRFYGSSGNRNQHVSPIRIDINAFRRRCWQGRGSIRKLRPCVLPSSPWGAGLPVKTTGNWLKVPRRGQIRPDWFRGRPLRACVTKFWIRSWQVDLSTLSSLACMVRWWLTGMMIRKGIY